MKPFNPKKEFEMAKALFRPSTETLQAELRESGTALEKSCNALAENMDVTSADKLLSQINSVQAMTQRIRIQLAGGGR